MNELVASTSWTNVIIAAIAALIAFLFAIICETIWTQIQEWKFRKRYKKFRQQMYKKKYGHEWRKKSK